MIDTPRITQTIARRIAVIQVTVPRSEIQKVMGPAIREVLAAVAAQGIAIEGPVFSHHFRMDPQVFDFEVGVPVSQSVAPEGRVRPGELASRIVAATVYHGPYEGLAAAWGELRAWIDNTAQDPAEDLWESYIAGPESSPDPANWRTELNQPLINYSDATS
jgi:effector-binding domain-containing protein